MSRYLIALGLAAILAGALPAARAAPAADIPGDTPSRAVEIHAAELASSAGITRVHNRLQEAARDVCRSLESQELELRQTSRAASCSRL